MKRCEILRAFLISSSFAFSACDSDPQVQRSSESVEPSESAEQDESLAYAQSQAATPTLGSARGWGTCPEGFASECATLKVPLNWSRPRGQKIDVLISRLPARTRRVKGQLWLLQGGPGGSGAVFSRIADTVFGAYRDHYDLMVMEHRGVGPSTRLSCPIQEADDSEGGRFITPSEFPDCVASVVDEWGDGLAHFSITQAARDLAHAISLTRIAGKSVNVYGVSYGTLWAQRFVQVDPFAADAVVLDSVLPPNQISVFDYDQQYDPVGADLGALCTEQEPCASKLGDDPWQLVDDTVHALASGHCPALGLPADLASALGAVQVQNITFRRHLFPFFYRIARCDEADLPVVGHYINTLLGLLTGGPQDLNFSPLLQNNIALSEINDGPIPTPAQALAACNEAAVCPAWSVDMSNIVDQWPTYEPDRYFRRWFKPSIPVLALNGDLDPQTPWEEASRIDRRLTMPWQHYVQIPYAPHVATDRSPVIDAGQRPCGAQIMQGFIENPYSRLKDRCLNRLLVPNFDLPNEESVFFFGQEDEWENTAWRSTTSTPTARTVAHARAQELNALLKTLTPTQVNEILQRANR